jgi:hypothetical protein
MNDDILIPLAWIGFWLAVIMTFWVIVQLLVNRIIDRHRVKYPEVPIDWRPPHEKTELPR